MVISASLGDFLKSPTIMTPKVVKYGTAYFGRLQNTRLSSGLEKLEEPVLFGTEN